MARVTNLQKYRADKKYSGRILGIKHVQVDGIKLSVKLLINGEVPLEWLQTLRWKVTHCQTGYTVTMGGAGHTPVINMFEGYPDEEGIAFKLKPLPPLTIRLEMTEQFHIDIETETEHLHFLNRPSSPSALLDTKPTAATQRPHLTLVRG